MNRTFKPSPAQKEPQAKEPVSTAARIPSITCVLGSIRQKGFSHDGYTDKG